MSADQHVVDPYPGLTRWVKELCRRAGIQVVTFRDGSQGLINVPAKYVAVIDSMHVAMTELIESKGTRLPEFVEPEPKKPKRGEAAIQLAKLKRTRKAKR